MKRRFRLTAIVLLQMILLSGCVQSASDEAQWGSFTAEDTYSYDKKYVAEQTITMEEDTQVSYIRVSIKDTEHENEVFHFTPARASDFWGVCWESDSYNIWIQSGDTGVICYRYEDETWTPDETAVRPDDIVSKYDQH